MIIWESNEAEDWAIEQARTSLASSEAVLTYLMLNAPNLNQQLQALKLLTTIRGYAAFQ